MHSYLPVSNNMQAMACMSFYRETRKHAVHIREGLTYRQAPIPNYAGAQAVITHFLPGRVGGSKKNLPPTI